VVAAAVTPSPPMTAPATVSLLATAIASMPTFTSAPSLELTSAPTLAPTLTLLPGPEWLQYLNLFRAQANSPLLMENRDLSNGSALHSRYMTYTGELGHGEDPASPYFTNEGNAAGVNGNVAATVIDMPPYNWAFNYWMSAAFHAVPMMDPELQAVGFGEYRDAAGIEPVTATLDIKSGLGPLPQSVRFPIMFPRDGGYTWVLRYGLPEFPFALASCPGYVQPSGPPIILQIGSGDQVPLVTGTAFIEGDKALPHCEFDETNYFNPDGRLQQSGRSILNQRDAIVLIPQSPLEPGKTFTVRVDVNGAMYQWSFSTGREPR